MRNILISILALWTGVALADLNAWNDGTNSSVRVNGVLAQSITNTALTASRVMVSGTDKSEGSVSTTALITGSGTAAVASDVTTALGYTPFNQSNSLPVFNAQEYGWIPDGTDRTSSATNLLRLVSSAGGGTIFFPPSTLAYRADGQLVIPNNGGSPQATQVNIRMSGSAGGINWYNASSTPPSVLDLRYSSTNGGKIETRGLGTLAIDNLTIKDGNASTNTTPLVHTSNTTLEITSCTFIGAGGSGQDAIVLGGTSTVVTNTVNAAFQGYGTTITRNHFTKLNRGVYLLTYVNSVVISDNTWQGNTGTVGLESDGSAGAASGNFANVITGNLFEMDIYRYGIVLNASKQNYLAGNAFWDGGSGMISAYYVTNLATQNIIVAPYAGTKTVINGDAVSKESTTIISGESGRADSSSSGIASSEIAYGLVVKGTYNSLSNYPGPLTVSDLFTPARNVSIGYDGTAEVGVIQAAKTSIAKEPLVLNPLGGNVGVGTTNPASTFSVVGAINGTSTLKVDTGAFTNGATFGTSGTTITSAGTFKSGGDSGGSAIGGNRVFLEAAGSVGWSQSAAWSGTIDTGILRDSAGVVRVSTGSSGNGQLITRFPLLVGSTKTLTATNMFYLVNVDNVTVTLPTAASISGRTYTIKVIPPATTSTVATTSSQLIDGASTYSLSASNKYLTVISDGTNWWNIANN